MTQTVTPIPLTLLPQPPVRAAQYGLVDAARATSDVRWQFGGDVEVLDCPRTVDHWDPSGCPPSTKPEKPEPFHDVIETFPIEPTTLVVSVTCAPVGRADMEQRARRSLELGTSRGIEEHYWRSRLAQTTTAIAGTGLEPDAALGALEQYRANCGVEGVIHARPELIARWCQCVADDGGVLRTQPLGTLVVAYTGSPNTGPDGTAAAAGTSWAYVTGNVRVLLDPIETFQDLERRRNDMTVRAERAAVAFDNGCCGPAAVSVAL